MIKLETAAVSDRGLSPKRPINEDRYLAMPEQGLFAVADGVGGQLAGEVASQTVIDTLATAITDKEPKERKFFDGVLQRANQIIYQAAQNSSQLTSMATTVALVYIEQERVIIAHVGDSRVYSFSGGQLKRQTCDHNDIEDAVRTGLLSEREARKYSAPNIINRAVGIDAEVEPEFSELKIDGIDALLLCTDGITRHLKDAELQEILGSNLTAQQICDEMKSRCYERGAQDNLTAVIVKISRADAESDAPAAGNRAAQTARDLEKGPRIQVQLNNNFAEKNGYNGSPDNSARSNFHTASRLNFQPARSSFLGTAIKMLLATMLLAGLFYGGFYVVQHFLRQAAPVNRPARHVEPVDDEAASLSYLRAGAQDDAAFQNALQLFDNHEYIAARDRLQNLIDKMPNNARYYYWQGRANFEAGDYNNALKGFQKSINLNLDAPPVYLYEALSYQALGREKESAASFKRYADAKLMKNDAGRKAEGGSKNR
jgi:protein phosphatase